MLTTASTWTRVLLAVVLLVYHVPGFSPLSVPNGADGGDSDLLRLTMGDTSPGEMAPQSESDILRNKKLQESFEKMRLSIRDSVMNFTKLQEKEIVRVYDENVMLKSVMENENRTQCILKTSDHYLWWVFNNGTLRSTGGDANGESGSWDLSYHFNNDEEAYESLQIFGDSQMNITTLSLAYNKLSSIPSRTLINFNDTLERLSLTGNSFQNFHRPSNNTPVKMFPQMWKLLELDLRNCKIQYFHPSVFDGVVNLERLFLSYNIIKVLPHTAFMGLGQLRHWDVSNNNQLKLELTKNMEDPFLKITSGMELDRHLFDGMKRLRFLDLSNTKIHFKSFNEFKFFNNSVEYLSLCGTSIPILMENMFEGSRLRVLDLSNNPSIALTLKNNSLNYLKDSLEILYLRNSNIKTIEFLQPLGKLKIVNLNSNNINALRNSTFQNLTRLMALDLSQNFINNWYNRLFTQDHNLRVLDLRFNIVNILTKDMLDDFAEIDYIGLANNNFECSCKLKSIFDKFNKMNFTDTRFESLSHLLYNDGVVNNVTANAKGSKHKGHKNRTVPHADNQHQHENEHEWTQHIHLFDYKENDYFCINSSIKRNVTIDKLTDCDVRLKKDDDDDDDFGSGEFHHHPIRDGSLGEDRTNVYLILLFSGIAAMLLLGFVYRKWWTIRYFCILIKNTTILSFFNSDDSEKIARSYPQGEFVYDVFVSYSEHNRMWVLDEFIPNIEKRENINICLHERDFIVGYTILNNIIDSIDKSRCLLLVISQSFVSSHWCKFEMHLAQHRLLETRRDELILVLLEDVQEKHRPKGLNFLMKTKTYLKWPSDDEGKKLFWKRLKKAIVANSNEWEKTG